MRDRLEELSSAEVEVLALVKMAVTARLAVLAGRMDPSIGGGSNRAFTLALGCRGLPTAFISRGPEGLRAYTGGDRPPRRASLLLSFGGPLTAARILSGGAGTPLPLPFGGGAFAALAFFRAAAKQAPAMLADPALEPALRARLLAEAALAGLAALASSDPWLAERLEHVPDGGVLVECPGSFAHRLEKRGGAVRLVSGGDGGNDAAARLRFRDAGTAVAVFTGAKPAILALATGEVVISGLIPLVQGLFAVLDRLGDFMAVRASGAVGSGR
jgi:hypothetical protein